MFPNEIRRTYMTLEIFMRISLHYLSSHLNLRYMSSRALITLHRSLKPSATLGTVHVALRRSSMIEKRCYLLTRLFLFGQPARCSMSNVQGYMEVELRHQCQPSLGNNKILLRILLVSLERFSSKFDISQPRNCVKWDTWISESASVFFLIS